MVGGFGKEGAVLGHEAVFVAEAGEEESVWYAGGLEEVEGEAGKSGVARCGGRREGGEKVGCGVEAEERWVMAFLM